MIDIETLGTETDAVVLSVGAVYFDKNGAQENHRDVLAGYGKRFYARLKIDEQLAAYRSITASTLQWWMEQSDDARKDLWSGKPLFVSTLWTQLSSFLAPAKRVWARGTHFDLAILQHLFLGMHLPAPWKYNAPRDSRTILDIVPTGMMPVRTNTAHNALDDAIYEAECVAAAMRYIDSLKAISSPAVELFAHP